MDDVELRQADMAEARVVADVWLRSRAASIPAIPPPVHTADEVREHFATVVLPHREVWLAVVNGTVAGLLALDDEWVDHLYIDPPVFGRGVGSQLIAVAKQRRPRLKLWAFQSNVGARRFYERHGFVAVAFTDGDNEEGEPDVQYVWERAGSL
jgi:GNAT superfamily N-acetyltransferase